MARAALYRRLVRAHSSGAAASWSRWPGDWTRGGAAELLAPTGVTTKHERDQQGQNNSRKTTAYNFSKSRHLFDSLSVRPVFHWQRQAVYPLHREDAH